VAVKRLLTVNKLLTVKRVKKGGGAEGDRTPDLLIANEALSQLSYGPRTATGCARWRVAAI
jgi:hypothetical protein